MTSSQPNLLTRDDTFFGVCAALGEDFGFNPLYLRLTLGLSLLWNPVAVAVFYVAAGFLVMLSRWLSPNPRLAAADRPIGASPAAAADAPEHDRPENDDEAVQYRLPIAA